ncbi:hypothetical protein SLNWT_6759 [Streptomyces albus]|uniref:Hydrogenase maturation protease n=1 Tax=Streptomyces albus (strain ATCC 21838 / DSM 41398 / FERM P-419 / JCM 4703 / NBRC 107858) TaxID=1081613 RepID=A0A0B5F699_STRA4|nr:hypothetical protein SLNWT_6759 [Streptomyces albus]AOU81440.1 hypothetical protein SLNHY_6749 [Streptomyces albus]AYN37133.1 protease [Streptomyces albus]
MNGTAGPAAGGRTLVAGIGNIFLGDDGFGVETVRRLRERALPPDVELADIGVRGVHLAYQLLDGYGTVILVDAMQRGAAPGTVHLIEVREADRPEPGTPVIDGHRMSPDTVLALLGTLTAGTGQSGPGRVLVVGCEPASVDEGMGLSAPVEAALDEAVRLVLGLLGADPESAAPPGHGTAPAPGGPGLVPQGHEA